MKRVWVFPVILAMLVILGLAALWTTRRPGANGEEDRLSEAALRVSLDFFPNPNHVPLYAALDLGYFANEGLRVEVFVPANPSDPVKLAAAKAVDLALTPQINYLIARAEGLPLVCLGALIGQPLGGLLAISSPDVRTLDDLAGGKIGYSLEPLEPVLWSTVFRCAGLDPSRLTWVNVGYNAMTALVGGHVDAIGAFRNYERLQLEELGHNTVFFPQEEYCVPRTLELIVVANPTLIEERDESAAGFLRALARGIDWTVDHPAEAADLFFSRFPDLDDPLHRRSFEETCLLYADDASYGDQEEWEELQRFLAENGLIERVFPFSELCVLDQPSSR